MSLRELTATLLDPAETAETGDDTLATVVEWTSEETVGRVIKTTVEVGVSLGVALLALPLLVVGQLWLWLRPLGATPVTHLALFLVPVALLTYVVYAEQLEGTFP